MSGWLCVGIVIQDTGGAGVNQGLQRRAQEVSGGPDMLSLRCQQGTWVDCQAEFSLWVWRPERDVWEVPSLTSSTYTDLLWCLLESGLVNTIKQY